MAGSYHSVFQAIGSYAPETRAFTAASLNGNVTSATMTTIGMVLYGSATVWVESGTPSGTFYIDVTDDLRAADPQTASSAKWVTVQSVVYTSGVDPNSNSASQIVWINGSRYCRARWVNSSGTGTGAVMITGVST